MIDPNDCLKLADHYRDLSRCNENISYIYMDIYHSVKDRSEHRLAHANLELKKAKEILNEIYKEIQKTELNGKEENLSTVSAEDCQSNNETPQVSGILENQLDKNNRITKALEIAFNYSQIDGDHHKAWAIDQMIRALCGCKQNKEESGDFLDESDEYLQFVNKYEHDDDGEKQWSWDEGVNP